MMLRVNGSKALSWAVRFGLRGGRALSGCAGVRVQPDVADVIFAKRVVRSIHQEFTTTMVVPVLDDGESTMALGVKQSTVDRLVRTKGFTGKAASLLDLAGDDGSTILVGLGTRDKLGLGTLREAGAATVAGKKKHHGDRLAVNFEGLGLTAEQITAFVEGMLLRDYSYTACKGKQQAGETDDDAGAGLTVEVLGSEGAKPGAKGDVIALIKAAQLTAGGVQISRDLANCPPNLLYPESWANHARQWAKKYDNVEVSVIGYKEAVKLGMGGLVGVGKGSKRKPCLVTFDINPTATNKPPVILGKGVTFDSGGVSIKPSAGMDEMKYDMHGSATVFGLMESVASSGHTGRVVGIAVLAENMVSGAAYRPGDVLTTYSGKTVEVLNTDAEGRLILADGLTKAGDYDPAYIIDLATLTGAMIVALGHDYTGMWSNSPTLARALTYAGEEVGELLWEMPLCKGYSDDMKSKIADLNNVGAGNGAGSSTAAAFLQEFVPTRETLPRAGGDGDGDSKTEPVPWIHLDIAGTAWGGKRNPFVADGGTGIGVRMLHRLITEGPRSIRDASYNQHGK